MKNKQREVYWLDVIGLWWHERLRKFVKIRFPGAKSSNQTLLSGREAWRAFVRAPGPANLTRFFFVAGKRKCQEFWKSGRVTNGAKWISDFSHRRRQKNANPARNTSRFHE